MAAASQGPPADLTPAQLTWTEGKEQEGVGGKSGRAEGGEEEKERAEKSWASYRHACLETGR